MGPAARQMAALVRPCRRVFARPAAQAVQRTSRIGNGKQGVCQAPVQLASIKAARSMPRQVRAERDTAEPGLPGECSKRWPLPCPEFQHGQAARGQQAWAARPAGHGRRPGRRRRRRGRLPARTGATSGMSPAGRRSRCRADCSGPGRNGRRAGRPSRRTDDGGAVLAGRGRRRWRRRGRPLPGCGRRRRPRRTGTRSARRAAGSRCRCRGREWCRTPPGRAASAASMRVSVSGRGIRVAGETWKSRLQNSWVPRMSADRFAGGAAVQEGLEGRRRRWRGRVRGSGPRGSARWRGRGEGGCPAPANRRRRRSARRGRAGGLRGSFTLGRRGGRPGLRR